VSVHWAYSIGMFTVTEFVVQTH